MSHVSRRGGARNIETNYNKINSPEAKLTLSSTPTPPNP
jgi:hypothetical protein